MLVPLIDLIRYRFRELGAQPPAQPVVHLRIMRILQAPAPRLFSGASQSKAWIAGAHGADPNCALIRFCVTPKEGEPEILNEPVPPRASRTAWAQLHRAHVSCFPQNSVHAGQLLRPA